MSETPRSLDEHTPTTIVYDIAVENANELIGLLAHRSNTAADPATREAWWQRVLAVRDARRAVDPLDRQALLDQISLWKTETETLKAGR
ncbi:hypothetical protein ACFVU3_36355 [Streptomyces sp. NPDC058052]|uniref:hypothetical protein n=1 Tax=Streptomyces sp. NPDC058052 TaxID=3346316 RepID=UPI0036E2E432